MRKWLCFRSSKSHRRRWWGCCVADSSWCIRASCYLRPSRPFSSSWVQRRPFWPSSWRSGKGRWPPSSTGRSALLERIYTRARNQTKVTSRIDNHTRDKSNERNIDTRVYTPQGVNIFTTHSSNCRDISTRLRPIAISILPNKNSRNSDMYMFKPVVTYLCEMENGE